MVLGVHTWSLVSIHGPRGHTCSYRVNHGPNGHVGPRGSSIVLGGHTWSTGVILGPRGSCMVQGAHPLS